MNRAERVLVTKAADHLRTVGVSCPDLDQLERIALAGGSTGPQSKPRPRRDPPELTEAKRQVRARSRGVCEAAAKVCTGTAVYFHHRKMRSAGGSHSAVNGLDVCLPCHDWIHGHPEASYERGLLLHSWENEGREVTG